MIEIRITKEISDYEPKLLGPLTLRQSACVAAGACVGVVPRSLLELPRQPPAVQSVPLLQLDTLLVRRSGNTSMAVERLHGMLRSPA